MKNETNTREVVEASIYPRKWEIYSDGSISVECSQCGKTEELKGTRAERFLKNHDLLNSSVCLSCWKANKDAEKGKASETIDDRIKYAQSWNLAVALMAPSILAVAKETLKGEVTQSIKETIEYWQKYFHDKLTNK